MTQSSASAIFVSAGAVATAQRTGGADSVHEYGAAQDFRLHVEELPLKELLLPLVEQHKLKADKPVHLSLDIEPDGLTVRADRTHLTNIISNLLDNAIKYSDGQAEITVCCRRYTGQDGETHTEIRVSDHGIGIAHDRLPHIFDKFYRYLRVTCMR